MKPMVVDQEQVEALIAKLRRGAVTVEEMTLVALCLEKLLEVSVLLKNRETTIQRLQKEIFGDTSEKTNKVFPGQGGKKARGKEDKKKKKHGKGSVQNSKGKREFHAHPNLKPGDRCPECQGRLHELDPRLVLQIDAHSPFTEIVHQAQRLRCGSCQKIFNAPLPAEVEAGTTTAEANAMVVVQHYMNGTPFYRQEKFQEALGVKLTRTRQFDMSEHVFDCAIPVFEHLEQRSANTDLIFLDDTGMKILEEGQHIEAEKKAQANKVSTGRKSEPVRTGMGTTGFLTAVDGHDVALFFTGRKHAGEHLSQLLARRDPSLPPLGQMSDAAAKNFPAEPGQTVLFGCNTHARRNFVDAVSAHPIHSRFVIEQFRLVFKNEAHCLEQTLTPEERLAYHQTHSREPMEEIRRYGADLVKNRRIEKTDALGKAFAYLENHWQKLTAFLEVPGAPLHNNVLERLLKTVIVYRKNSLFYKTAFGARVADVLMSLIQTTVKAKENPFEYLVALQRHRSAVFAATEKWLPWNFRTNLI